MPAHLPTPPGKPSPSADKDLEAGGTEVAEAKSALPFKPLVMTFRDVRYSVPMPPVRGGQAYGLKGLTGLEFLKYTRNGKDGNAFAMYAFDACQQPAHQ